MAKEVTVTLSEPVEFGSEVVSVLVFRRPKVKEMRAFPLQPGHGDLMALAGELCARSPAFMDKIDVVDMHAIEVALSGFLQRSPPAGENS